MKIGIILGTNEPEVMWNAFRFGVRALTANHTVKVFLLNSGVELEEIHDNKFNVEEQVIAFTQKKGEILACGTCLKSRHKEGSAVCPLHTIDDLLTLVEESDKILTFG
ncbi:MAG: DsrE family protein [Methanoregula sp.]|nr:DsrE family protein [Methanoregula sp.]